MAHREGDGGSKSGKVNLGLRIVRGVTHITLQMLWKAKFLIKVYWENRGFNSV
jgi:hypothetical protein